MKYGLGAAGVLAAAIVALIVGVTCFGPDPDPPSISGAALVAAIDDEGPDAFSSAGATTVRRMDPGPAAEENNALKVVRVSIAPLSANRVIDFIVFPTSTDARRYANSIFGIGGLSGSTDCDTGLSRIEAPLKENSSTCYGRSSDVVIIASALLDDVADSREEEAQGLLDRGLEVVRALRAREIPASATSIPLSTATPTPTREPTPTAAPSPTPPAPVTINAGEWNYLFTVVSNTCSFGGGPGSQFPIIFLLEESTPNDNLISPGELVRVTEQASSFFVGSFTFTSPNFDFSYPVAVNSESGIARVSNTYTSANTGTATFQETYVLSAGGTCVFSAVDQ